MAYEEWRPTHHPDYDVSNLGRVRSRKVRHPTHTPLIAPRILKCSRTNGYPSVGFWPDKTRYLVHLLVLRAFVGTCPEGCEALHKDDNRTNARLDNLEYGTHLQNVRDCLRRGRQTRRLLTFQQVTDIRTVLDALPKTGPAGRVPNGSVKRVAARYSVSERCIEAIFWRKNWTLGY